jgi:protein SFI1
VDRCKYRVTHTFSIIAAVLSPDRRACVQTTHEQVAQARETLNLRLALHRWRARTAAHLDLRDRVAQLADRRLLRLALRVWADRVQARQQAAWRHAMRAKMRQVRARRDAQALADAWAAWRRGYGGRAAEARYQERLVARMVGRWRGRLARVDEMEARAEAFAARAEERGRERMWERWRAAVEFKTRERHMEARVDRRVLRGALHVWKDRRQVFVGRCLG